MKLAGGSRMHELSHDAFHQQAREYDAVPDVREGLIKLLQMQGTTHPFAVIRFAELDRWVADGEYQDILADRYPRREDDDQASVNEEVKAGRPLVPGILEPFRRPLHRPGQGLRRDRRRGGRDAVRRRVRPPRGRRERRPERRRRGRRALSPPEA
jgi:hypothetical protein